MAIHVLTTPKIYVGEYDLSGDMNSVASTYSGEPQDNTTFGGTTRTVQGGLKKVTFSAEGFWNGGDDEVDDALFSKINVANVPVTLVPEGETIANACYLFRALHAEYSPFASGTVGEMLRFSVSAEGSGGTGPVRGTLFHVGSETATGTETKVQIGAVAAGESLYAALHVLTVSGTNPTLNVLVRSDADASAGGESTRITFTQATAITSEWKSVAGAITDEYWDVSFTIGGTNTPTFEFVLSVGII